MRSGGAIGGRAFTPPIGRWGSPEFDFSPLEPLSNVPSFDELAVSPIQEPYSGWRSQFPIEPQDPTVCDGRDPNSPFCGGIPFRPVFAGLEADVSSNDCETCVMVTPIFAFVTGPPVWICHRDPACRNEPIQLPPTAPPNNPNLPDIPQGCRLVVTAGSYSLFQPEQDISYQAGFSNAWKQFFEGTLSPDLYVESTSIDFGSAKTITWYAFRYLNGDAYLTQIEFSLGSIFTKTGNTSNQFGNNLRDMMERGLRRYIPVKYRYFLDCPNSQGEIQEPPIIPPPPPPPTDDTDYRNKGKNMCCQACEEGNDISRQLLKQLKLLNDKIGSATDSIPEEVAGTKIENKNLTQMVSNWGQANIKLIGASTLPIEVPISLISGIEDSKTEKLKSLAEVQLWLIKQVDALAGEFPVVIEVQDLDLVKKGDQKQTIKLQNISEALAETYETSLKTKINGEVALNALLRLATEITTTKVSTLITQDYAKANALFLGYKGNVKVRDINMNFDLTNPDLLSPDRPFIYEDILKTSYVNYRGWENDDKETVVGFLQKLMFAAGIIKSVFFRGKKDIKRLEKEAKRMGDDINNQSDVQWDDYLKTMNDPNNPLNEGVIKPEIKNQPIPNTKNGN